MQLRGLGERCRLPSGVWAEPQPKSNLVHFGCKIWHLVATVLIIFLRINLPNFVQFKQYRGKSGPRVLLFKARFFTTVNINSKQWYLNGEKQKCRLKFATRKKLLPPNFFQEASCFHRPVIGIDAPVTAEGDGSLLPLSSHCQVQMCSMQSRTYHGVTLFTFSSRVVHWFSTVAEFPRCWNHPPSSQLPRRLVSLLDQP